jgi:hypothetical protein
MDVPHWACLATIRRSSVALILAGCATGHPSLDQARASWENATYDEVVAAWGKPARSDGQVHAWYSESTRRPGGPAVGVGVGGGSGMGMGVFGGITFGTAGEAVRCDRIFTFHEGRVASQRWLGPADYCERYRR